MTTPTITAIQTTTISLPMHGALRWGAHSSLSEGRYVLVTITLSDGSTGIGEAPPRPTIYGETTHSIRSVIEHELAPRLIGMPAEPVERVLNRLHEIKFNHTAKGALDMALHVALANHHGLSLAAHLGCTAEKIKVSYILGIGQRAEVLAEAQRVVEQGVRVLKVKVGREWEADLQRIKELQAILPASVSLYADANECMNSSEASWKLAHLREQGLLYCEEPLPVELIQERATLRRQQQIPLIADDSAFTLRDLQRELALDTFDILNIKTARTGFTESRQMLHAAQQASKGVMIGSQAAAGWGTVLAAHFSALPGIDHPCELSFFLKLQADILDRSLRLQDGYLYLSDVQQVGVDPTLITRFEMRE